MFGSFVRKLVSVAALAALGAGSTPALADVRYDFTAFSSIPFQGQSFSGSFSVVLPDFVTSATIVPAADLLACSVSVSPAASASCSSQSFLFDVSPGSTTVTFGVSTAQTPNLSLYYYFDATAFSTLGTHATTSLGVDQAGQLTVSSVPEPAQWGIMMLGLVVVASVAGRRRRAQH